MKQGARGAWIVVLAFSLCLAAWLEAGDREEERIEAVIEALVEAYRNADVASMGRFYAPEVRFVPADYNPPVRGWEAVAQRYRKAFSQLSGLEMLRENTRIERRGKLAWATYQWRLAGLAGNQAFGAFGHTTLILEKRGRNWVILYNHTSALPGPAPEAPEPPAAERPK